MNLRLNFGGRSPGSYSQASRFALEAGSDALSIASAFGNEFAFQSVWKSRGPGRKSGEEICQRPRRITAAGILRIRDQGGR